MQRSLQILSILLAKACYKKQENERVLIMVKYSESPSFLARFRKSGSIFCNLSHNQNTLRN